MRLIAPSRRLAISTLVISLALMASLTSTWAQVTDPVLGTWKLNVAQSKFAGGRGPKSQTVRFLRVDGGTAVTSEAVGQDGRVTRSWYIVKFDGKRHPIMGSPTADSVSFKLIDKWTVERSDTKAGRVTAQVVRVLSKDGKTLTVTSKAFDTLGRPVLGITVFNRT